MKTPNLQLDHVFVFTRLGASPVASCLQQAGFTEGSRATHPGQGTSNRRFFFNNAYLELIWVDNESEVRSPLIAKTQLWERSNWQTMGRSPFGVSLRQISRIQPDKSFPTWDYLAPYLPPQTSIYIADNNEHHNEPLIFIYPPGVRPDSKPDSIREPLNHVNGASEITKVTITLPEIVILSEAAKILLELGIVHFIRGKNQMMEITLDHSRQGKTLDLRPHAPLVVKW